MRTYTHIKGLIMSMDRHTQHPQRQTHTDTHQVSPVISDTASSVMSAQCCSFKPPTWQRYKVETPACKPASAIDSSHFTSEWKPVPNCSCSVALLCIHSPSFFKDGNAPVCTQATLYTHPGLSKAQCTTMAMKVSDWIHLMCDTMVQSYRKIQPFSLPTPTGDTKLIPNVYFSEIIHLCDVTDPLGLF